MNYIAGAASAVAAGAGLVKLSPETLSTAFAAFVGLNGLLFAVDPCLGLKMHGGRWATPKKGGASEDDGVSLLFTECIAYTYVGYAVSLGVAFSLLPGGVFPGLDSNVRYVIGLGLLPRIAWGFKTLFGGRLSRLGLRSIYVAFLTMMLSIVAVCELRSAYEDYAPVVAKVASCMGIMSGSTFLLSTESSVKRNFGLDVSKGEKAREKEMFKSLGEAKTVHSIFMAALAFGAEPQSALGYTSIAHLSITLDETFHCRNYEALGLPLVHHLVLIAVESALVYRCLF